MSVTHVNRLQPSVSRITDAAERDFYWQAMLRMWNLPKHIEHFPGPNPMSVDTADFERIRKDDFLVALKSDGVRHLLLLMCKPRTHDPIALMIDRTKTMYEVEIWANEDFYYHGALYDGELVWEDDKLTYIVFDVVHTKGTDCIKLPYRERMTIVHNTILCVGDTHTDASIETMLLDESKFLARNNPLDLLIKPKTYVHKANLKELWEERESCSHRNDGVIFTQNSAPIGTGTCASILKWKPSHSIDVQVRHCDGSWRVFANKNNSDELEEVTDALGEYRFELQESKLLDALASKECCIVECVVRVFDAEKRIELFAERERTDKIAPNTLKTIEATIRNDIENISPEDMIRLVEGHDVMI